MLTAEPKKEITPNILILELILYFYRKDLIN